MAKVNVNIQKAASINADVAHILIEVPHVYANATADEIAASVAQRVPGARMLPGSLHRTGTTGFYGLFVRSARSTMALEQASTSGFTKVSDTVFSDPDDNIWSVQRDGNGSYLVQEGAEDIAALLQAVQVRSIATASVGIDLEEHFEPNQPIMYYDTRTETAAFAIGLDNNRAWNPDTNRVERVPPAQVLAVYDRPTQLEFAAAPKDSLKAAIAYYTELYGHNAAFLTEIKRILREVMA